MDAALLERIRDKIKPTKFGFSLFGVSKKQALTVDQARIAAITAEEQAKEDWKHDQTVKSNIIRDMEKELESLKAARDNMQRSVSNLTAQAQAIANQNVGFDNALNIVSHMQLVRSDPEKVRVQARPLMVFVESLNREVEAAKKYNEAAKQAQTIYAALQEHVLQERKLLFKAQPSSDQKEGTVHVESVIEQEIAALRQSEDTKALQHAVVLATDWERVKTTHSIIVQELNDIDNALKQVAFAHTDLHPLIHELEEQKILDYAKGVLFHSGDGQVNVDRMQSDLYELSRRIQKAKDLFGVIKQQIQSEHVMQLGMLLAQKQAEFDDVKRRVSEAREARVELVKALVETKTILGLKELGLADVMARITRLMERTMEVSDELKHMLPARESVDSAKVELLMPVLQAKAREIAEIKRQSDLLGAMLKDRYATFVRMCAEAKLPQKDLYFVRNLSEAWSIGTAEGTKNRYSGPLLFVDNAVRIISEIERLRLNMEKSKREGYSGVDGYGDFSNRVLNLNVNERFGLGDADDDIKKVRTIEEKIKN
jgi:hypothetical protein